MIERAKHALLPINIAKIFVHGSYLRGEPLPGDLDVIILGDVKEQWAQW
jgi:predicted nucleotidyltransferase